MFFGVAMSCRACIEEGFVLCQQGTFKENLEIAKQVADHAPFGEWLKSSHRLSEITKSEWLDEPLMAAADVLKLQAANGELMASVLVRHCL